MKHFESSILILLLILPLFTSKIAFLFSDGLDLAPAVVDCDVDGGTITGTGPYTFCVNDGQPDYILNLLLTGNVGPVSQWVITNEVGTILVLPENVALVDFDGALPGNCLIYHISYEPGLNGLSQTLSLNDLQGCYHLSNAIEVIREDGTDPDCGIAPSQPAYAVVGREEVVLENAVVYSGGVGVVEEDGQLELTDGSIVTESSTFINAPDVVIDKNAQANNVFAQQALPDMPVFLYNNTNAGNDLEIDIDDGEEIVLTEPIYEDLKIGDDAIVVFSGQEYVFIEDIQTGDNTILLFDQCTNLMLSGRMRLGKYNDFNPGEERVMVFAEKDIDVKKGSSLYGFFFTQRQLRLRESDEAQPGRATGLLSGKEVKVEGNTELWAEQVASCDDEIDISISGPGLQGLYQSNDQPPPFYETELDHSTKAYISGLYPNPASESTTLQLELKTNQTLRVEIFNTASLLVHDQKYHYTPNEPIELSLVGLHKGIYVVYITSDELGIAATKLVIR